ncbi:MAG: hypothetical protein HFJ44_08275 [Clostridia bacterium]|jgi:hypothetical protein|nr:hypothetical protein [Clostridia bacterium]
MATKTLYTAIGRFERRTNGCGRSCPVILLGGKEHMVDMQEMVLWTSLNWRIAKAENIAELCSRTISDTSYPISRSWEECLERLLVRGLVISGNGDTEYDALYDLLSPIYVIPSGGSFFLRTLTFIKLTLFRNIPISRTKRLFARDRRTDQERQVMNLARQALLSTAEIIKCIEKDIRRLPDEESILELLYDDAYTTSDNINSLVRHSSSSKPVTLAVANLYLRQQIIFERI